MILSLLDQLLLLSALTVVIALVLGRHPFTGWLTTALYALQLDQIFEIGQVIRAGGGPVTSALGWEILGHPLVWRLEGMGWFFALITLGAAFFVAWFAAGKWLETYPHKRLFHVTLALNVLTMLLFLSSGDLLGLFIAWELVSWAGYLMMTQSGGVADRAAFRYLLYALGGAMGLFAGVVLVQVQVGSLLLEAVMPGLAAASPAVLWAVLLLFGAGFAVKLALLPFHQWQAEAYGESPGPAAAFLGAVSSRMGLVGLLILMVQIIGFERLSTLYLALPLFDARTLLAWVAAFTIVVPTYIALRQSDARLLLAWHGIGQSGYMLLGVLVGDALGVAGGLLHVFNYATYQAALFLSVTAVMYRTGTADLDRLGGLITRMPLAYVTMLLGIIGLAGLPPMNGFVSKWMIYRSLLEQDMPLLFIMAVIGTLGTILSVYKLIHNTFLGQLRMEHRAVREAPWAMTLSMLVLGGLAFVTGAFPGLALDWVALAQQALGFPALDYHLGGVARDNGSLNMIWVTAILLAGFAIGALIYFSANRSYRVDQLDNYAGGHMLSADVPYHYSHNFYPGLMRAIGGWYVTWLARLESGLGQLTATLSAAMHGLYQASATPQLALGGFVALLLFSLLA